MATYAIGDVHGQYEALMRLLDALDYQDEDRLWFVGDLVNRGPKSLEVLRFVSALKGRAVKVLGNHDFSILVQAQRFHGNKVKSTAQTILQAPDGEALIDEMRFWRLAHFDSERQVVMAHAGVYPQWSVEQAKALCSEVMKQLQGADYRWFLQHIYGDKPICWLETLQGMDRWRFAVNAFCRMRFVDKLGCLELDCKLAPADAPEGLHAWFEGQQVCTWRQLFGHWASLGLQTQSDIVCLDSGAAWQGALTAFDVDKWQVAAQVVIE